MARTAIRTATLIRDDINSLTTLFGTVTNAYRQLGLSEVGVEWPHFYRAMNFDTITPAQKEQIEAAWERWKYLFFRPEVPASSDYSLNLENRDEVPPWHPEHDELNPDDELPIAAARRRE